jgi:molecular chaperone GrpE (heat shock protein)
MPDVPKELVSPSVDVAIVDQVSAEADTPRVGETGHPPEASEPRGIDADRELASDPQAGSAPTTDLLHQVLSGVKSLEEEFSQKLKYDQAKEKAIDALHEELRQHRGGLHFSLLRPLLTDLISLHDDVSQLAAGRRGDDAEAARTFDSLASTVEELLARQGVFAFNLPQDTFDGKQQRAVRTVGTDRQELVGAIAERVRVGFAYEGRTVRPEHVALYVLRSSAEPTNSLRPEIRGVPSV